MERTIEMWTCTQCDEKLRAVCVRTLVGHAQQAKEWMSAMNNGVCRRLCAPFGVDGAGEVLIGERPAVYRLSACSIPLRKVCNTSLDTTRKRSTRADMRTAPLYHKVLDRPMNNAVLVVQRVLGEVRETLFARAEGAEAGTERSESVRTRVERRSAPTSRMFWGQSPQRAQR